MATDNHYVWVSQDILPADFRFGDSTSAKWQLKPWNSYVLYV